MSCHTTSVFLLVLFLFLESKFFFFFLSVLLVTFDNILQRMLMSLAQQKITLGDYVSH